MSILYSPSSIPLRIPFAPNRRFNFTKPIRVTNLTTKLTDYQIVVNLDTTNFAFEKARCDGADIRFQDANGNALSYWIESWTSTSAKIWVKLDELESYDYRIIWLIYGNYDASNGSNGDNTFLFFDDFLGSSLDTNKWEGDINYATLSGSILDLYGTQTVILRTITSISDYSLPHAFKTKAKLGTASAQSNRGAQIGEKSIVGSNGVQFENYGDASTKYNLKTTKDGNITRVVYNWLTTVYSIFEIITLSSNAKFYKNDVLLDTINTNVPTTDLKMALDSAARHLYIDWIFMRKCVAVIPLVEVL